MFTVNDNKYFSYNERTYSAMKDWYIQCDGNATFTFFYWVTCNPCSFFKMQIPLKSNTLFIFTSPLHTKPYLKWSYPFSISAAIQILPDSYLDTLLFITTHHCQYECVYTCDYNYINTWRSGEPSACHGSQITWHNHHDRYINDWQPSCQVLCLLMSVINV